MYVEPRLPPAGAGGWVGWGGAVGPSSRPAVSPCSPAGGHPSWDSATHILPIRRMGPLARPPGFKAYAGGGSPRI